MTKAGQPSETIANRYHVTARIASGGMGEVYRARDSVLGRTVALKVLPLDLAMKPGFVKRFRAEAQAAARLNHPNVVQVHDWGETDTLYYMVMEYVRGRNLREALANHGRLAPRQACLIIVQVLEALGAAHGRGLVHRDIKPENLLVTLEGKVKVADFGLARAAEEVQTTGGLVGTVAYVAPEQARGLPVDGRTDIYATGCVLYELLTGSQPFEGDAASILNQHLTGRVPAPSADRPEVGAEIDLIVQKATAPDPAERYATALEMRAALEDAVQSTDEAPPLSELTQELTSEVPAEALDTMAPGVRPPRRRLRRLLIATLVIAGIALAAFLVRPAKLPDVIGMNDEQAKDRLVQAGFGANLRSVQSDEEEGKVVDTDPDPGRVIRRGRTVVVEVSRGPAVTEVPVLKGLQHKDALAAIKRAGLDPGRVTYEFSNEKADTVLDQTPEPGQVLKGTPINLVLSKGPEMVDALDVRGKFFDEARAALAAAGLRAVRQEVFADPAPGKVVDQIPPPGVVAKGSEVRLVVSKGPEPFAMPELKGHPCAEAKGQLEGLGLVVVVNGPECSSNRVVDQDPPPGAKVRREQSITLYV